MMGFFLLQSCQYNDELPTKYTVKAPKLSDAARYNTELGVAYLKQGNRALAKHKLLLASAQAPDDPAVNSALAYFMEQSGEISNARLYYQKAMLKNPKAGMQLNNYGAFLCRQGDYRLAEDYFIKAVNDNQYEHTAGAYENAGLCVMEVPDIIKAVHYFKKALEHDPNRVQSLYELVRLELKRGNINSAMAYLQKYPKLSLHHPALLALAIEAASKARKTEWAADYNLRLQRLSDNSGEKNEHNNSNG